MLTRAVTPAFLILIILLANAASAATETTGAASDTPAEPSARNGSMRSAAELLVADEAALGCHLEASADQPNPGPCDVFLKLTATSDGESRRQAAAHNNRGLIMVRLGGLEEALDDFEAALALAPTLSAAEVNRGTVLFRMGLYPDALQAFESVIANDADHRAAALFNRSFVYRALGELDLAAADLASAAAMDATVTGSRQPLGAQARSAPDPIGPPADPRDQAPE
ncbi:MAG: tetratricopeptide repeat protein [Pseudomonadales bacterium]|nr:tetratricopeptide repeat protein [Pseudomonadales bacterium]NIX06724.1 tetratricopeptide repeat protein [Pseudomonadales bacterium]